MWWEWWEKQKTHIQQISRTPGPPHLAAVFLCATSRMLKGKQLVLRNSAKVWWLRRVFRHHLGSGRHASAKYFLPAARGLVSNLSLVWYSKTGLVYRVLLVWSGNHHFEFSKVPQFHGYWDDPPVFVNSSCSRRFQCHFRMGLLYFGRWKECKIHGFLHSLLLRWSRDFKPGSWMGR